MSSFGLGFSSYDIALLIWCPVGSVIGSLAYVIMVSLPSSPPTKEHHYARVSDHIREGRKTWIGLRFLLGGILGFLLGLYFVGAIQETPSTLAKVIALSIVAGYSAPRIWLAQDKMISSKIEVLIMKKLESLTIKDDENPTVKKS